ncbi:hypothetical protein KTR66_04730 [Roseococcus sp. SDR]|uniref:hypothetical protein n=1 Tax=Roseococcus sp. SDR TaxID=2835532 RepID=UPI001BD13B4E|nr:hypothetical protein [Roseococcus sp. SDR]MBS7789285.1 hypothetical protein [Roseococcus sp. SDR]MBV1844599.1 hypothetical protein [Roseococcus sp. SDR]
MPNVTITSARQAFKVQGPGGSAAAAVAVAAADRAEAAATTLPPVARSAAFTLAAADAGKMLDCTAATTLAVTLPNNLAAGLQFTFRQGGVGEILFSPASGATLQAPGGATRSNGQFATALLIVMSNTTGTNAVYTLGGRIY